MANGTDAGPGARNVGADEGAGATAPPLRPAAPPLGAPFPLDVSAGLRGLRDSRTDSVGNGTDSGPGARNVGADEGAGATAPPLRPAAPPLGAPFPLDVSAGLRGLPDSRTDSVGNGTDSGPGARNVGADEVPSATSSPLRPAAPPSRALLAPDASGRGAGGGVRDICDEVMERLVAGGHVDPGAMDLDFRELLAEHFGRFSESYQQYAQLMRPEDIFIHMKLLKEATQGIGLPPFHVQFLMVERLGAEATDIDALKESDGAGDASFKRSGIVCSNIHEVVFGYIRNPKLRMQLSSLLANLGLSITRMHLFTTSDGYFLDSFTVAGWNEKDTVNLVETIQESILRHKRSWFGSESASFGTYSSSYNTLAELSTYSSSYNIPAEPRIPPSRTRRHGSIRRLQIIKTRKRAERVKQEKIMESFKAILSSFLFPTILTIFTSDLSFSEYEKPFVIIFFALGGMLILLAMVMSHGVEDGPRRTSVVFGLTLGVVLYVYSVFMYCTYKFFVAEFNQVIDLYSIVVQFMQFISGAALLSILWWSLFK